MATTTLGNKAVGSIIQLKENGKLVSFYVAKHNYENSLNGMGRTLVVRKDCYDTRQWHSSNVNAYASSAIDSWLNGTYKNLLDADIRGVIGTTKIKYTPGNGNNTVGTLQRAIFLLSATELNRSASWFNVEGTALEIASSLQIAYMNGSAVVQWTRSPCTGFTDRAVYLNTGGNVGRDYCTDRHGSRPAFTLPSTTLVDDSGSVVIPDLTAHKTLVNGTVYTVQGGKCMVGGAVYNILKGRTLIGGTGYDIPFGSNKIKVTITAPKRGYASVTIDDVRYSSAAELEVDPGTAINCAVKGSATNVKGYIYRNGEAVGSSNAYSMTVEKDVSIELSYVTTISGSALIYHGQINITD